MIKLVALDLDGTVVDERLAVSERVRAVLSKVQAMGEVKVVLATGRMFPSTLPFAQMLGLTNPTISYQGAMIRDISQPLTDVLDHPILFHQPIDILVAEAIIGIIHEESLHANLYVNDQLFTTHYNPHALHYQFISGVTPQEAPNLFTVLTGAPSKMMIIDDRCDVIADRLREQFSHAVSVCRSRHNYCEIVHASVSKWLALQQLMAQWGIQPSEVLAIGDQENDLSMIEGAGIGVAMGNAPDHVKQRANYVTRSIAEDGAAEAIERFVFGHLPFADV